MGQREILKWSIIKKKSFKISLPKKPNALIMLTLKPSVEPKTWLLVPRKETLKSITFLWSQRTLMNLMLIMEKLLKLQFLQTQNLFLQEAQMEISLFTQWLTTSMKMKFLSQRPKRRKSWWKKNIKISLLMKHLLM